MKLKHHHVLVVLIGITIILLIILLIPNGNSPAFDAKRKTDITNITNSASLFCKTVSHCPTDLHELSDKRFISKIPVDPKTKAEYSYSLTEDGLNCLVSTKLSSNEIFSQVCVSH